jgi:hypothetical protein
MQKPADCEQILEIKDRTSVTIIKEFMQDGAKLQFNSVGETKGRYQAQHTETVDIVQKMDGTNEWESRAIDVTHEGDMVMISGKGMGRMDGFQGEYMFMTQSPNLAWLNGTKAYVEGMSDMRNNTATIKVYAVKEEMAKASAPM